MKKTVLSICLAMTAGCAFAQNNAFYKAQDKMNKGELTEAESIVEAALANPKTTNFAKMYNMAGQIEYKIYLPQLQKAAQQLPFDTLAFCTHLDKAVNYFNKSEEANQAPDEKGRVKADKVISLQNKIAVSQMLDYYNYAAMFMNANGNKEKSVEYFQKYAEMPKSAVFTQQETDSIYASKALNYQQTRFNLAYLYYQQKDWDKTIAACDEALKDTMGIHDLYVMKIGAYGEKKDSTAWAKTLVEASKRTGSSNFQQQLLYYYMSNQKIDDAMKLANDLVTESPNDKNAWFMKGAIELNVKKDYATARESFEKAIAIDPDFGDALFNMGTAYINDIYDQRISGKFKYIGTNRRIEGKTSDGSYQKNKAIYDKELATVKSYYEKAKPYLEHFRELTPNEPKRWASALQMVYSSLGMKDKAKEMDDLLDAANHAE